MQIRTGPPPRLLAGAPGAEPLDLGSDWSHGAADAKVGVWVLSLPRLLGRVTAGRVPLGRSSDRKACGSGGHRPAAGPLDPSEGHILESLGLDAPGRVWQLQARLLGNVARRGRNHVGWLRGGGWTQPRGAGAAERVRASGPGLG